MSKTISYRGTVPIGVEEKIRLKTNTGKTGYKITQFQIIGTAPGTGNVEYVGKITNVKDPNVGATVNFTNSDLLAVSYLKEGASEDKPFSQGIIFDNQVVNQDIFVAISDAAGGTTPCNYYIELETMNLSDLQTTQVTLKNMRQVTSR